MNKPISGLIPRLWNLTCPPSTRFPRMVAIRFQGEQVLQEQLEELALDFRKVQSGPVLRR